MTCHLGYSAKYGRLWEKPIRWTQCCSGRRIPFRHSARWIAGPSGAVKTPSKTGSGSVALERRLNCIRFLILRSGCSRLVIPRFRWLREVERNVRFQPREFQCSAHGAHQPLAPDNEFRRALARLERRMSAANLPRASAGQSAVVMATAGSHACQRL